VLKFVVESYTTARLMGLEVGLCMASTVDSCTTLLCLSVCLSLSVSLCLSLCHSHSLSLSPSLSLGQEKFEDDMWDQTNIGAMLRVGVCVCVCVYVCMCVCE
jgi:hypothetical protein